MYDGGQCDNKVFKEFIIKQYSKRVKSNGIQWGDSIGIWHSKNVSNYFHDKMVCNLRGQGEQKQINRYQDQLANAYTTYVKKNDYLFTVLKY